MKTYTRRIYFLLATYLLALFILSGARMLFFLLNKSRFSAVAGNDLIASLFYGIRFDMITSSIINALFILLLLLPVSFLYHKRFRGFLKALFLGTNLLALACNMVDIAYFPFILRRSTAETFFFFFQKNDTTTLLPLFLKDFWYLFLLFFVFAWLLNYLYKIIEQKLLDPFEKEKTYTPYVFLKSVYLLFGIGLNILIIRGGTQLIPLGIIDAGNFVKPSCVPIVLNTPFCLIKSGELYTIEEKRYLNPKEADALFLPIQGSVAREKKIISKNVVLIILESFSKEFTGLGKRQSYTPFLDSLMQYSLVYTRAFANGKRSIEGIPAIVASIPSFQSDYISTVYSNNKITSLANLLKKQGYHSSFFHGGTNGTMNFNGFCATAGFDRYFGRNEFGNEKEYDGSWGIWDEPFLQAMVQELGKEQQPFFSSVFTLTSHHPFQIPEAFKNQFPEGKLPITKCIQYTDYALRRFFAEAKKSDWFSNTLFIFTADHTGPSEDPFYSNPCGNYEVPLFFYQADNLLKGRDSLVTQQLDIMPTTLGLLKYPDTYFSFGLNVRDSLQQQKRFAINYYNGFYQYFTEQTLIQFNGNEIQGVYHYKKDSLLVHNLAGKEKISDKSVKAFIQQYTQDVIHNRMHIP